MDIHIIANAALGSYLSGGDRIFIECARRWASAGHRVRVYVWEEGLEMCRRNGLEGVEFVLWPAVRCKRLGFAFTYLARTVKGALYAVKAAKGEGHPVIYSASDFWPDSLPAFLMKLRLKGASWVAGFYLFAPNPFKGFRGAHKKGVRVPAIKELLYYVHQLPAYALVKGLADSVFVTCDEDRDVFIRKGRAERDIVAVRGGVDARTPEKLMGRNAKKEYDACFVGRFHPQKGVIELISIWDRVVKKRPDARLAVIGADSEEYRLKVVAEIERLGLEGNVDLLGFLDGERKYEVFLKSRIIVHPAVYDSGGMAACEGMAWGLPAVGFDLPALGTYYPKGMLKAPVGDHDSFASLILKLLEDEGLYTETSSRARELALEWDWEKRADELLRYLAERFA